MIRLNSVIMLAGRRRLFSATCFASAILIATIFALSARAETGKSAAARGVGRPAPAQVDYLPPVLLIDQSGKSVSLSSVKGKPVLVGFIHTSCKGVCEMMTAKMKQVAQSLGAQFNSSVTMVSITTDPDEDNPAQLLKYAKAQGVDAEGYLFLTGKHRQIDRLLNLYDVPDEGSDEATTHVLDLFLVAPNGSDMRKYNGISVSAGTLASDIRHADSRR